MRPELPGFYYDPEKNRYFPVKGPIPGASASKTAKKAVQEPTQATNLYRSTELRTSKLLCLRELNGNAIPVDKGKSNFRNAFQKMQASHPVVWKYQSTYEIADAAIQQVEVNVETPEGQTKTNVLLTGSINGYLSLLEVGKVGELFDDGTKCVPDKVWPVGDENKRERYKAPGRLWRPAKSSLQMPSRISCIKVPLPDDCASCRGALITTLGGKGRGSMFLLNLSEAVDFNQDVSVIAQRTRLRAPINGTIWTADCKGDMSQAVIGTNFGAAMIDLEAGTSSFVLQSKSDVLALQLDQLGNKILCGLRNGTIVAADTRDRHPQRLIRHRVPYESPNPNRAFHKKWFELKGNIDPSHTIHMPSSISCLASLRTYDQYFLASSMDGSIKLYDGRMVSRGAVQSYEGHVNSHSRIQLSVDPSERFVMSGGEECGVRVWCIKSGQLLSESKFSNSIPYVSCWPGTRWIYGQSCRQDESVYGTWLGSQEGIFYTHLP